MLNLNTADISYHWRQCGNLNLCVLHVHLGCLIEYIFVARVGWS